MFDERLNLNQVAFLVNGLLQNDPENWAYGSGNFVIMEVNKDSLEEAPIASNYNLLEDGTDEFISFPDGVENGLKLTDKGSALDHRGERVYYNVPERILRTDSKPVAVHGLFGLYEHEEELEWALEEQS